MESPALKPTDPADTRILLVDDDPASLMTMERALSKQGYDVVGEVLPHAAQGLLDRGPFHIVITDYVMPGLNGLELLRYARAARPEVMRILVTGEADLSVAISAINQGEVFRFLTKPLNMKELEGIIRIACRHLSLFRELKHLRDELRKRDQLIAELKGR